VLLINNAENMTTGGLSMAIILLIIEKLLKQIFTASKSSGLDRYILESLEYRNWRQLTFLSEIIRSKSSFIRSIKKVYIKEQLGNMEVNIISESHEKGRGFCFL
jgi:hypothetical protein